MDDNLKKEQKKIELLTQYIKNIDKLTDQILQSQEYSKDVSVVKSLAELMKEQLIYENSNNISR